MAKKSEIIIDKILKEYGYEVEQYDKYIRVVGLLNIFEDSIQYDNTYHIDKDLLNLVYQLQDILYDENNRLELMIRQESRELLERLEDELLFDTDGSVVVSGLTLSQVIEEVVVDKVAGQEWSEDRYIPVYKDCVEFNKTYTVKGSVCDFVNYFWESDESAINELKNCNGCEFSISINDYRGDVFVDRVVVNLK